MQYNVLLLLQGIPASGKSTYAKELVARVRSGYKYRRVNRDDIRRMLGDYNDFSANRERIVTRIEHEAARAILALGESAVIDATNLNPKHRREWEDIAEECGALFQVKFFDVDLKEALRRNEVRPKIDRIDPQVIVDMYNKWIK